MLVLHEKIIRQFHLVYHIHHGGENRRQNGSMNVVASGCHLCRHHQTGFASAGVNCFLTGVEYQGRRFKTLREKSFPGRTGKWRRFCKVCKCGPPFSVRVPVKMKIISDHRLPVGAKRQRIWEFLQRISFLHFVQSLHKGGKHFRQNGGYESHIARTLPVPASPNLGLPPATRKLCGKRTSRPRKSDRLIDWQRRNFSFCAFGTPLADQLGIRCGQMTNEMKLKIVRNMNKAVFENW